MKKIGITVIKSLGFFLGWAILVSLLPLSSSKEPAIWRLWVEITPLLAIVAFTLGFWLAEKKDVKLHLFDNPAKGVVLGVITGIVWLAIPVFVMYAAKIIHFDGTNFINLFPVWMLAVFLNTIMQELLVRGYLYQMLKQKHNIIVAAIVTTILFTALHGGAFEAGVIPVLNRNFLSLGITLLFHIHKGIIGCRQALDFLAFRYFL